MALCRILLAALIALAVTVAPVGAALATAPSPAKAAVDDCHKKPAKHCSDCDSQANIPVKCPGDGSKCCKLAGTIVSLPSAPAVAVAIDRAYDPQKPPDWKLGPRPPPPRS